MLSIKEMHLLASLLKGQAERAETLYRMTLNDFDSGRVQGLKEAYEMAAFFAAQASRASEAERKAGAKS
jgi:hypothetical protein